MQLVQIQTEGSRVERKREENRVPAYLSSCSECSVYWMTLADLNGHFYQHQLKTVKPLVVGSSISHLRLFHYYCYFFICFVRSHRCVFSLVVQLWYNWIYLAARFTVKGHKRRRWSVCVCETKRHKVTPDHIEDYNSNINAFKRKVCLWPKQTANGPCRIDHLTRTRISEDSTSNYMLIKM